MKQIIKTSPPKEFVDFCQTPGVSYCSLSGKPKRALREQLLKDQGYICCYCGCEIHNDENTHIEHIASQAAHSDHDLDYNNMLAACDGGVKDRKDRITPPHQQHCDAKKKDKDLPVSPLTKEIEDLLIYFEDGTVKGRDNQNKGNEIIQILGLNVAYLVTQRKNAWDAYSDFEYEDLIKELEWIREKHKGKYEPYCFVLEQCIQSYLSIDESETELDTEAATV